MTSKCESDLWLRRYHPAPAAGSLLICLPHAGGSAGYYRPVARALAPDVDVLVVQYPGRQERYREPFADSLAELAAGVRAALSGRLDRPFAFFGHSMGAIVAFETARLLERDGGPAPFQLFASGRRAPGCRREEAVHRLGDDGIVRELRALNGSDPALLGDEDVLSLVLPAVRADYRLIETYRGHPDARVGCPVTVLVGEQDPLTTRREAEDWARHTTAGAETLWFPGGHFYLADRADEVLAAVTARMPGCASG